MTFQQTIPAEAIKAAALFAARDMGRYAFHGLALEHGRLIATDGRRLAVIEWTPGEGDTEPPKPCILPTDAAIKAAKAKGCEAVCVNGGMEARDKFSRPVVSVPYQLVEGEFPDVKAVLPRADRKRTAEAVRLNPDYLADIGKAAAIIQQSTYHPCLSFDVTSRAEAVEVKSKGHRCTLRALLMPIAS